MKSFVHLHLHTDFSMLDGMGTIERYVARAKKLGMPALAITDHGNIAGTYQFYKECMDAGIKPILGEEFYYVPDARHVKDEKEGERFHVVIIAKNEEGYRTLVWLSTRSHQQYYYKPLIDRPTLESLDKRARKNLIVLSGCAGSRLSRLAIGAIPGDPEEELRAWSKLFPNFFVELQHHDTEFDRKLNRRLHKMAVRHDLPWVITNDPHYVLKEEHSHHDALLAIQTASDIDAPDRFRFDGSGYHLRSRKEMARAFRSYDSEIWKPGLNQTLAIAKSVDPTIAAWESRSWHIPAFPKTRAPRKRLGRLVERGLRERGLADDPRYAERAKHELKEFRKVKMENFLLITADAIKAAKELGVRTGPGRGSVCGTLVGYAIGIHKIDPIRYDLLFERFLNPERPKMPDIDSDFARSGRSIMFEYTDDLYGVENTMRVGAYDHMRSKSAFKSLASSYGIPYKEAEKLSSEIEEDEEGNIVLPKKVRDGYPDLVKTWEAIVGIKKGIHRHPAGVIIFDPADDIRELIPQMWIPSSKQFVAQFDLDAVAGIGLLKQDFLGLRTLDTIDECLIAMKKTVKELRKSGVEIDPDDWVPDEEPDDDKIYAMLAAGRTHGVFQMEGSTNHRGIQEIKCERFEDIVSCTSLYRAGPLGDKADERFLKNKRDGKVRVLHPKLKPFLSRSWGEMIYQEQMFEILKNLAGFSWARVDDAKTAMTKKDPVKMAALKDEAIAGFMNSGFSQEQADAAWEKIAACAGYLFNRSHAVAYSMLTYQTARLKFLYPQQYWAALLSTVKGDSKESKAKRERYMAQAHLEGYKLLPPDINKSGLNFTPEGSDGLRFGLEDIKGVGEKVGAKLIEGRPKGGYKSAWQVEGAGANRAVMEALEASGALSGKPFHIDATDAEMEERLGWQFTDRMASIRKKWEAKYRPPGRSRSDRVILIGEIIKTEKRKTKKNTSYMTWTIRWQPGEEFKINLWDSAAELWELDKGSVVKVVGDWNEQYSNTAIGDADDVQIIKSVYRGEAA